MLSVFYSLKYASWQLAALFLGPVPGGRFNKTLTLKINSEFITSEIAISVPEQLIRDVRGTLSIFEMYISCADVTAHKSVSMSKTCFFSYSIISKNVWLCLSVHLELLFFLRITTFLNGFPNIFEQQQQISLIYYCVLYIVISPFCHFVLIL